MASYHDKNTPEKVLARLVARENGCLVWPGATNGRYGQARINNVVLYVHRIAYEHHVGRIPESMTIDHLCGEKLCANVLHLEVVTNAENTGRAARARGGGGCRNGHGPGDQWIDKRGHARCRPCHRATQRRYYWRRRNKGWARGNARAGRP